MNEEKYNISVKLNKIGKDFLDRLGRNRIKQDSDLKCLTYGNMIELLYKYFRDNDKNYKDLLKMEYKKNGN